MRQVLGGYPLSGVPHLKDREIAVPVQGQCHRAARCRGPQRVADQIADDLAQSVGVGDDVHRSRRLQPQCDSCRVGLGTVSRAGGFEELAQVDAHPVVGERTGLGQREIL